MSSLRKISGPHILDGYYTASGSLAGVSPGRRRVEHLTVRRLHGARGESLAPLADFGDLVELQLEHVSGVSLDPLAGLSIEQLVLEDTKAIDVSALGESPALRIWGSATRRIGSCRGPYGCPHRCAASGSATTGHTRPATTSNDSSTRSTGRAFRIWRR